MKLRLFALIVSMSLIAWAQQTATPSTNSTSSPKSKSCCHHSADGKDVKACCRNASAEGCCGKDTCEMKEGASCCGDHKDMEACAKHCKENRSCGKDCCANGKADKTATTGCCESNKCERHPQTAKG